MELKDYCIKLHKELRKYRYFYYELHQSLITDYDYDILEKKYDSLCDNLKIPHQFRVSNFVGFSINIPMNPYNFINK